MRKNRPPRFPSAFVKLDSRGQRYVMYPDGQLRRISSDGGLLPRLKMSKKERLKLRWEYQEIERLDRKALADKILETPVINPSVKASTECLPGGEALDA